MKFTHILKSGISLASSNWKYLVLFWFTNAAVAFVMSVSVYYLLIDHLQYSLMSSKIAAGFQHLWFIQFLNIYKDNLAEIPVSIYGFVGIYALVQTFYSGGLISIFNMPKKNHIVDFFYGGVKFWYRFVKVLIISLIFYAAVFFLNDLLGYLISLSFANTELVAADFLLRSLRYLLLIFLILAISMITDYSKVSIGINDQKEVLKSIGAGIKLITVNFGKIFSVFLFISVIGMGFAVVYNVIGKFIPRTPSFYLILSFILQQVLIIFRLLIRMFFYSTEVLIFKDINAEVVVSEVEKVKVNF